MVAYPQLFKPNPFPTHKPIVLGKGVQQTELAQGQVCHGDDADGDSGDDDIVTLAFRTECFTACDARQGRAVSDEDKEKDKEDKDDEDDVDSGDGGHDHNNSGSSCVDESSRQQPTTCLREFVFHDKVVW